MVGSAAAQLSGLQGFQGLGETEGRVGRIGRLVVIDERQQKKEGTRLSPSTPATLPLCHSTQAKTSGHRPHMHRPHRPCRPHSPAKQTREQTRLAASHPQATLSHLGTPWLALRVLEVWFGSATVVAPRVSVDLFSLPSLLPLCPCKPTGLPAWWAGQVGTCDELAFACLPLDVFDGTALQRSKVADGQVPTYTR